MYKEVSKELLAFLKKSPTQFHAIDSMKEELLNHGYVELKEDEKWDLELGGQYFTTRNESSIIAFHLGKQLDDYGFHVVSSHSDYPTFKLKENAELEVRNKYVQLNTEAYGGAISSTWFDRPLSVAGRVLVKEGNNIVSKLVKVDRDLVLIPNVAIHQNRGVNDGFKYNNQIDLLPLFAGSNTNKGDFKQLIANELNVETSQILGSDLYLYSRVEPSIWGLNEEFISSPHLDDLQCGFASLKALLNGYNENTVSVLACFDNEEVGSLTKQGAAGTFLKDVLKRIHLSLNKSEEDYYRAIASSFMLSADNAHALHPNHPEKADPTNQVYLNEGVVVKQHAGQRYTSNGISIAIFKDICDQANVPVQFFANRSDVLSGGTLGNIAMAQVSMDSVDIGIPQLAMHSAYESAGIKDTYYMIKAMEAFFNSPVIKIK